MKRNVAIIVAAITGIILLIMVTDGDWAFIVWLALCVIIFMYHILSESDTK